MELLAKYLVDKIFTGWILNVVTNNAQTKSPVYGIAPFKFYSDDLYVMDRP